MITKTEIKRIHSLSKKKYRKQFEKFIIEGIHPITEAIKSETQNLKIYMADSFLQHPKHIRFLQNLQNTNYILVDQVFLEIELLILLFNHVIYY